MFESDAKQRDSDCYIVSTYSQLTSMKDKGKSYNEESDQCDIR